MNRTPSWCQISTSDRSSSIGDGFWNPKMTAVRPALLRATYIGGGMGRADQIRKILEPAIPLTDIGNRLAEILVIADRDMDRGDAARVQLPENLLRPVAILQAVDEDAIAGCHESYSGAPALT